MDSPINNTGDNSIVTIEAQDKLLSLILKASVYSFLGIVIVILGFIFGEVFNLKKSILPLGQEDLPQVGVFITTSLLVTLSAISLIMPLSFLSAVALVEFYNLKFVRLCLSFIRMASQIPSVVYAFGGVYFFSAFVFKYIQPLVVNFLGPESIFADFLSTIVSTIFYPFVIFFHLFDNSVSLEMLHIRVANIFSGTTDGFGFFTTVFILALFYFSQTTLKLFKYFLSNYFIQKDFMLAMGASRYEIIKWAMVMPNLKKIISVSLIIASRVLGDVVIASLLIGGIDVLPTNVFSKTQNLSAKVINAIVHEANYSLAAILLAILFLFSLGLFVIYIRVEGNEDVSY